MNKQPTQPKPHQVEQSDAAFVGCNDLFSRRPFYSDDSCTIYHGDCRKFVDGLQYDLIVTDPPYGAGYVPRGGRKQGTVNMDSWHIPSWDQLTFEWVKCVGDVPLAVFCGQGVVFRVAQEIAGDGLLVYLKTNPNPLGSSYEPCVTRGFAWPRGKQHVAAYNAANGQVHPTQKPLGVMRFIVGVAPPGIVCDPFMGSGTTLVAAKLEGRKAVGIEIEERYCEVAANRLRQGTLF